MSNDALVLVVAHRPEHGRRRVVAPAQAGPCCCSCCCCCLHTIGGIAGALIAPRMGGRPRNAWEHLSLVADWDEEEDRPAAPTAANYCPQCDLPLTSSERSAGVCPSCQSPLPGSNRDHEAITEADWAAMAKPIDSARPDVDGREIALPNGRVSAVSLFWWTTLALVASGLVLYPVFASGSERILIAVVVTLMLFPAVQLAAAIVTAFILCVTARPDTAYQFRQLAKITLGMLAGTAFGFAAMLALGAVFGVWAFIPWLMLSALIGVVSMFGVKLLARRT